MLSAHLSNPSELSLCRSYQTPQAMHSRLHHGSLCCSIVPQRELFSRNFKLHKSHAPHDYLLSMCTRVWRSPAKAIHWSSSSFGVSAWNHRQTVQIYECRWQIKDLAHQMMEANLESVTQNKYLSVVTLWDFTSSQQSRDSLAGQPAFGYQTWLSWKPSFDFSKGWSCMSDCSDSLHGTVGRYQCVCINVLEQVNMAHGEGNCVGIQRRSKFMHRTGQMLVHAEYSYTIWLFQQPKYKIAIHICMQGSRFKMNWNSKELI